MVDIAPEGAIYEWQRFGEGFVKRLKDTADDWEIVSISETPQAIVDAIQAQELRSESLSPSATYNGGITEVS
jgi:hypothetical protein